MTSTRPSTGHVQFAAIAAVVTAVTACAHTGQRTDDQVQLSGEFQLRIDGMRRIGGAL